MKFIMNGKEVEASRVAYEDIIELAGYSSEMTPTVTYRNGGADGLREGILYPGNLLTVNEKTVINCQDTSNA